MAIEYKAHTADVQMVITAKSLEDLFMLALKGMGNIICEKGCDTTAERTSSETIHLEGTDVTNLMIDFLSDALSLSYIRKTLFCAIRNIQITENSIKCEISGYPIQKMDEEIKAVTYHGARVCKNEKDEWTVSIIFDI